MLEHAVLAESRSTIGSGEKNRSKVKSRAKVRTYHLTSDYRGLNRIIAMQLNLDTVRFQGDG